jgi:DNA repair photolyase
LVEYKPSNIKEDKMNTIYEPKGKAREYSPLAVNLYSGCGHRCSYCYVPNVMFMDRKDFDNNINERKNIINVLAKDAKSHYGSKKQVLMSFTTDPYNPFNDVSGLTRQALEIFLDNKIPVAILTKSGMRALQDLDIFKQFGEQIKVGASLTYDNDNDSKRIESGAALPGERLQMLKTLHNNKIKTWVSFEPIMQPDQTINLLKQSMDFVDEYQFGKLANDKRDFDWNYYVGEIVGLLRLINKPFYIKETLRKAADKIVLRDEEKDMDYLTLRGFDVKEQRRETDEIF